MYIFRGLRKKDRNLTKLMDINRIDYCWRKQKSIKTNNNIKKDTKIFILFFWTTNNSNQLKLKWNKNFQVSITVVSTESVSLKNSWKCLRNIIANFAVKMIVDLEGSVWRKWVNNS